MYPTKSRCLIAIYVYIFFAISVGLIYIIVRDANTLQYYHIVIHNTFIDQVSNQTKTVKTNQTVANDTNIYIRQINSKLKIKVTTYGRIIDPNIIYQPDPIPIFDDRISIVNPSLIKVPNFIENKLGTYYLYFAHHNGPTIYLAISNDIFGPYKLYKHGAFHMNETKYGLNHIASPDVHIDFNNNLIEMYYHTNNPNICQKVLKLQKWKKTNNKDIASQCTLKAISKDGLHFTDEYFYLQKNLSISSYILGHFYFRVFKFNNKRYAFAKNDNNGGILYGYIEYINKWIILRKYANIPMRHSAIFVDKNKKTVFLFITIDVFQKGDIMLSNDKFNEYQPESIWMCIIDMNNNYELKDMTQILKPNMTQNNYDGISLQSPAIYFENENIYLLYCLNAEKNGIAIAKIDLIYSDHEQYTNQNTNNSETELLIWPRIPKTGGTNFMHLIHHVNSSIKTNTYCKSAYITVHFTIIPHERYDTEYVCQNNTLNIIKKTIHDANISKNNDGFVYLIQNHIPFVPSINDNITLYLQNKANIFYNKWKYISFIRDPVSRIVSSFNYIRGNSGGWRSKVMNSSSLRWLFPEISYKNYLNYVKYYIPWIENKTHHYNIDECVDDYNNGQNICKLSVNYYVKWFCGVKCDPFNITEQSLYKAIENIDNYFEWIGVLEFYDVSFAKFAYQFPKFVSAHLKNNYLKITQELKLRRKQMGYGSSLYQMPSEKSLKILMKANELDYKLFYYVLEKYNYQ